MSDLRDLFDEVGVDGFVHAVDIDSGAEVGDRADQPVVPASVFKVPVLLELFSQAASGRLDIRTPVQVPVADRATGPFGLSVMADPVTMSLRDLAWLMIGISDNAATDVICAEVGLDNVEVLLHRLGLHGTAIGGDCRALFRTMAEDAAVATIEEFPKAPDLDLVGRLRVLDPTVAISRTTARDMTRLLRLIWTDEAATPEACEETRRILGLQVWPHRLASGFTDDDVTTSGKTGTLPTIRNEVGVVTFPDGGRYAVAVFTRSRQMKWKEPQVDAVIGRVAARAVELLRA